MMRVLRRYLLVPALIVGGSCFAQQENAPAPGPPKGQQLVKVARVGDESVTLRFVRAAPPPNPREAFNDDFRSPFFAPLSAYAAAGDDWAAAYLWEELRNCTGVPNTEAEQRAQLERITKDYAISNDPRVTLEQVLASAKQRYQRCDGITEASYAEALGILRNAADHGDARAELDYASAILKDQPEEARQRFEALWNEGHTAALARLADDSLAYRIASDALTIAYIDDGQHPGALPSFRAHADQVRNANSPSAYNEAAKKAAELLRNPNCCIVP